MVKNMARLSKHFRSCIIETSFYIYTLSRVFEKIYPIVVKKKYSQVIETFEIILSKHFFEVARLKAFLCCIKAGY